MAKEGTKQDRAQENVYLLSDLARLTAKKKLILGRKRAPYKTTNSVFIVLMLSPTVSEPSSFYPANLTKGSNSAIKGKPSAAARRITDLTLLFTEKTEQLQVMAPFITAM